MPFGGLPFSAPTSAQAEQSPWEGGRGGGRLQARRQTLLESECVGALALGLPTCRAQMPAVQTAPSVGFCAWREEVLTTVESLNPVLPGSSCTSVRVRFGCAAHRFPFSLTLV